MISMLEILVTKARAEVAKAAKALQAQEPELAAKAVIDTKAPTADVSMHALSADLQKRGIKTVEMQRATKQYAAQLTVFSNATFEITVDVDDDGSFQAALWDEVKQKSTTARKTKLVATLVKDIKRFATNIQAAMKKAGTLKKVVTPKAAAKAEPQATAKPVWGNSATKARNWILKNIGGKSLGRSISSNPYDDTQQLGVRLTKTQAKQLIKKLTALQIDVHPARYKPNSTEAIHDGVNLYIGADGWVTIMGAKKAKRSNLPYYD